MTEQSLAQPARSTTREERGLALAAAHFETIAASHFCGTYLVPSASGSGTYHIRYTDRDEECTCADWRYRGLTCQHLYAVAIVAAKTRACDGCSERVRRSELIEVTPERAPFGVDVLEGERYCRECARRHGVL